MTILRGKGKLSFLKASDCNRHLQGTLSDYCFCKLFLLRKVAQVPMSTRNYSVNPFTMRKEADIFAVIFVVVVDLV